MSAYTTGHLALMHGFMILGAIAGFFAVVMCLVVLISGAIDRISGLKTFRPNTGAHAPAMARDHSQITTAKRRELKPAAPTAARAGAPGSLPPARAGANSPAQIP